MPEGDTVARTAVVLREALVGSKVRKFSSPLPILRDVGLEGCTIERVETRGKNLLIAFDDGRTLHTHLRMSGDWHLYGESSPWRRPARTALVIVETDADRVAVLFRRERSGAPPIIRLLSADALRRDHMLRALGPDLLATDFDVDEAARRLHASIHPTIAEALLDQRDVAGIGNEYKSELLFLLGIHPHTKPRELRVEAWRALLEQARSVMFANVRRTQAGRFALSGRTTRFASGSKVWVYGRARKPCLRCGETVRFSREGLARRSTYFCPRCQTQRKP